MTNLLSPPRRCFFVSVRTQFFSGFSRHNLKKKSLDDTVYSLIIRMKIVKGISMRLGGVQYTYYTLYVLKKRIIIGLDTQYTYI